MSGTDRAAWLRAAGTVVLCLSGVVLAGWVERRSEERANRLHRSGEFQEAALVYGSRTPAESARARVRYNLGTALSALGSPTAAAELEGVVASPDTALRVRALYNLGRLHLVRARGSNATDSAMAYASQAMEANKQALRLEPGRADARWNLSLAQRMLDSMNAETGRAGTESVDGTSDSDERVLSDDLREFEDASEIDDAPREGSDEALAEADESAPLSAFEADAILAADGDRSVIVRKILTYESRVQRRVRVGRAAPRW